VLAKFVSSKDFERLPFEKQRLYYKVLDDRGNELDDAFKQGRVTEGEYRNALEAAWLGKHLNHVEKYFSLAPGSARANYIDQLVTKKVKKDAKNGKDENVDPDDPRVDETAAELRTELWPSNVRTQWEQFHNVYHQEKKLREKAATRPGTK
jgi:hypothetical protein